MLSTEIKQLICSTIQKLKQNNMTNVLLKECTDSINKAIIIIKGDSTEEETKNKYVSYG